MVEASAQRRDELLRRFDRLRPRLASPPNHRPHLGAVEEWTRTPEPPREGVSALSPLQRQRLRI